MENTLNEMRATQLLQLMVDCKNASLRVKEPDEYRLLATTATAIKKEAIDFWNEADETVWGNRIEEFYRRLEDMDNILIHTKKEALRKGFNFFYVG